MTLLTELDAFYLDHRRCGELESGVDGPIVWIACDCGASIARRVDEEDRPAADWGWTPVAFFLRAALAA